MKKLIEMEVNSYDLILWLICLSYIFIILLFITTFHIYMEIDKLQATLNYTNQILNSYKHKND